MLAFFEAVKPLLMGPDDMGNTFDHIPLHSGLPVTHQLPGGRDARAAICGQVALQGHTSKLEGLDIR